MTTTQTTRSDVTLPSAEEIGQLPQSPRLAFGARCARRALSVLSDLCGDEVVDAASALGEIVDALEQQAAGDRPAMPMLAAEHRAYEICTAAREASADPQTGKPIPGPGLIGDAAEVVAYVTRAALHIRHREASAVSIYNAVDRLRILAAGTTADGGADLAAFDAMAVAVRTEFRVMLRESERCAWVDSTSIQPAWFDQLQVDSNGVRAHPE